MRNIIKRIFYLSATAFILLSFTSVTNADPRNCDGDADEIMKTQLEYCEAHLGCREVTTILKACEAVKSFVSRLKVKLGDPPLTDSQVSEGISEYSRKPASTIDCLTNFNLDRCKVALGLSDAPDNPPAIIAPPKPPMDFATAKLRRSWLSDEDNNIYTGLDLNCDHDDDFCRNVLRQLDVLLDRAKTLNSNSEYLAQLPAFDVTSLQKANKMGWTKVDNNWNFSPPSLATQEKYNVTTNDCNRIKARINSEISVSTKNEPAELKFFEVECAGKSDAFDASIKEWKRKMETSFVKRMSEIDANLDNSAVNNEEKKTESVSSDRSILPAINDSGVALIESWNETYMQTASQIVEKNIQEEKTRIADAKAAHDQSLKPIVTQAQSSQPALKYNGNGNISCDEISRIINSMQNRKYSKITRGPHDVQIDVEAAETSVWGGLYFINLEKIIPDCKNYKGPFDDESIIAINKNGCEGVRERISDSGGSINCETGADHIGIRAAVEDYMNSVSKTSSGNANGNSSKQCQALLRNDPNVLAANRYMSSHPNDATGSLMVTMYMLRSQINIQKSCQPSDQNVINKLEESYDQATQACNAIHSGPCSPMRP